MYRTYTIEISELVRVATIATEILINGRNNLHQIIVRQMCRTVSIVETAQWMIGLSIRNLSDTLRIDEQHGVRQKNGGISKEQTLIESPKFNS